MAPDVNRKLSRAELDVQRAELRARLLDAQFALREARVPLIIIVSGVDGAGKGELVHRLNEWLDPRGVDTHAFMAKSPEELERPRYWRYWRALPAKGRVAILFGSWYTGPILQRVYGETGKKRFRRTLERIASHERMLCDDGFVILKFWLHLSRKAQRKRLRDMEDNPLSHWRVLPQDWEHHSLYDDFIKTSKLALTTTDPQDAPWRVIPATSRAKCESNVLLQLVERMEEAVKIRKYVTAPRITEGKRVKIPSSLAQVNLDSTIEDGDYRKAVTTQQARLNRLVWAAHQKKISSVLVLEGWDAAGKGSAIRRVTAAIDPRLYRTVPIAAPKNEELEHHYLWRFWRELPRAGMMTIFDRSWYGRVLVERVEGFASTEEWQRAYDEINDFEAQLLGHDMLIGKFWLHISKEEQLARFKKREEIAYKRHKITEEDWRNRKRWNAYEKSVDEMVFRTSTADAPWNLIAGNNKKFARVQILKTLCSIFEKAL